MASVRMSGELRNRIFENFKRQIYKVYEDNSGLQDYLKSIMESFYSVEERELMSDYMELHERLFRMKYPKFDHEKFSPKKYFGSYQGPKDFNQVREVHFIINSDRPDEESLTFMIGDDWHPSYTNRYDEQENAPSNNYLDGDTSLTLKLDEPIQFIQKHERSNIWSAEDVSSLTNPIIISSSTDINNINKFAEGTLKINSSKEQIKHLLASCTTLKRFLDTWPAVKDCVPQEYLDRMFAENKPKGTTATMPKFDPNAILPDEVKEEMNSTVLTSKLLDN